VQTIVDTWEGGVLVVEAGAISPNYKLIQLTEYDRGKTYSGKASQCTFEFKLTPEQIPGTSWLGKKVANTFASKVADQGSEMLKLEVYEDTTPTLWTNYLVIATCIETSPFPWAAVIVLILVILFVVAIIFAIKEVKVIDWGTPAGVAVAGVGIGIALAGLALVIGAAAAARGKGKKASKKPS